MAGRKPKPSNLHVLHGTDRADRAPSDDIEPEIKAPDKPSWLNGNASKVWDDLAPKLTRLGLLTEIDAYMFAMLCQEYGHYMGDQKVAERTTAASIAQVRALAAGYGLDASSRRGLTLKKAKKENDPWSDL